MHGCFFTAKPWSVKSVNLKCPLVDSQWLATLDTGRKWSRCSLHLLAASPPAIILLFFPLTPHSSHCRVNQGLYLLSQKALCWKPCLLSSVSHEQRIRHGIDMGAHGSVFTTIPFHCSWSDRHHSGSRASCAIRSHTWGAGEAGTIQPCLLYET